MALWKMTGTDQWSCWVALLGLAVTGPAIASPEIAVVTEPACDNEVIVVTGEGLDPQTTKINAFCLGMDGGSFRVESLEDPTQRRQTVIVSVLESLRQHLASFTLSRVIEEIRRWSEAAAVVSPAGRRNSG